MAQRGQDSSGDSPSKRARRRKRPPVQPGRDARRGALHVRTFEVGGLPLINQLLERMQLEEILQQHLPPDDVRLELPTARALLVLVRNVLISREPIYAVPEWAAQFAPDLLDLFVHQLDQLHDDRLGRCLDRLFQATGPELILAVVRRVVRQFQVQLDELHNDSTTVSFYGAYRGAAHEARRGGRATAAITWGYSKDHRPDLKQLLYTLTISDDGGIPVYFTTDSGNKTDDTTHTDTWDLLCQLVGSPDFLYVADCKLASSQNLKHVACHGGRFVTVLPRTHGEDEAFRSRLQQAPPNVPWREVMTRGQDQDADVISVCDEALSTSDGFRLFWYHSTRKARQDETARADHAQAGHPPVGSAPGAAPGSADALSPADSGSTRRRATAGGTSG